MGNRPSVAEQSHKREMGDAVRGDFERLRARRERSGRGTQPSPVARAERVVLTRPRSVVAADPEPRPPVGPPLEEAPAQPGRTWLRSVLRRRLG